jgi:hypothetical protein
MDQTIYGSENQPIIVSVYHVEDDIGWHRFLTINDFAMEQLGGKEEFEEGVLAEQFRSYELLGTAKVVSLSHMEYRLTETEPGVIRRRIVEISKRHEQTKHQLEPWLPEGPAGQPE